MVDNIGNMASSFGLPDAGVLDPRVTQVFKSSSQALLGAPNKQAIMLEGARKVLKYMFDLWQGNKLCDVILECNGGQRLFAHKIALGAYSDLLSSKFSSYPVTELMTIDVREFSRDAVQVILVFVYTTELNVNAANLAEVLMCATELDFPQIRNFCGLFLNGNINTMTVFPFMDIASRHRLGDVMSRLELFLNSHLPEVLNTDGFLTISGDRLIRLLTEHKVSRRVSELEVFLAVVRWIDYRRAERRPLAPSLFRLINFHLISPKDLINHVEKVQLVTESIECFQMLYTAMSFHAMRMMSPDSGAWNKNLFPDASSFIQAQNAALGVPPVGLGGTAAAWHNFFNNNLMNKNWQDTFPPLPRMRDILPTRQVQPGLFNQPNSFLSNPFQLSNTFQLSNPFQLGNPFQPNMTNPNLAGRVFANPNQIGGMFSNPNPLGSMFPNQPGNIFTNLNQPGGILNNTNAGRVSFFDQRGPSFQPSIFGQNLNQNALSMPPLGNPIGSYFPLVTTPGAMANQPTSMGGIGGPPPYQGLSYSNINNTNNPMFPLPPQQQQNPFASMANFMPAGTSGGMLVVVAVGGVELETSDVNTPGRAVFQYNPGSSAWSQMTALPHNTHHHGVAVLNDKLYVIGGAIYTPNPHGNLGDAIATTHIFDIKTRTWSRGANMNSARAYLAVCADNNFIYAVGGEDQNRNRLDSVERYDSRFNVWTQIGVMPSGGKVGAACTVYNNKMYVVGGYNSRRGSQPVMDEVDCLDLQSNAWMNKRRLPEPRCHASLVSAMGRLYLIGGRTKSPHMGVSSMASILMYDEARDMWNHVANLQVARHDAGCAAIGSNIYVVGGIRSPSPSCLATVECWDCVSGQWRHPVPNLPYTAAGLDCATVKL